jgi:hypothetical protein
LYFVCRYLLYLTIPPAADKTNFIFMNPEIFHHIHWLAVLVAAVAYFALGAVWYSKVLFAKTWLALTKIDATDPNATKGMGAIMGGSFVTILVACIGLAILVAYLHLGMFSQGLKLGALTGVCFGATAISNSYLYEKRATGLHFINGGYTLVGNIIAAVIICVWQ